MYSVNTDDYNDVFRLIKCNQQFLEYDKESQVKCQPYRRTIIWDFLQTSIEFWTPAFNKYTHKLPV